ncbi:MAG TPA: RNA polymerase sigma-70 factor [Polyangiaceae bacterium]|nr:RNA polymerase sigma-70 factor [Polyangiaceae bacterium]
MIGAVSEEVFREQRPRLFALAYRMLGSAADADDVLQDAWFRWQGNVAELVSPGAWLTTVVTRLCLDQLKSARARRESYVGPWLPEPLPTSAASAPADPAAHHESISMAFLVLLEQLTPAERASYLLHDVFDYSYAEVAEMLCLGTDHCRQLALRARGHLRERRPRFAPSRERHERLLHEFLQAIRAGELAPLQRLLSEDVVLRSDGGGKVTAAIKPILGSERVARFFLGLTNKILRRQLVIELRILDVNGWPAILSIESGKIQRVLSIEGDGTTIHGVYLVLNPDKLQAISRHLDLTTH